MKEVMSMLQAKETATANASLSTRGPKRHRRYVNRDREAAHFRLWHDYFNDDCVYAPPYFHRRYHIWRTLLLSIMNKLVKHLRIFVRGMMQLVVLA
jgi:hypothetical protein